MEILAPLASASTLAFFDREADEGDAEGVHRFLTAIGPLLQWLMQNVVVRAAQAATNDVFC